MFSCEFCQISNHTFFTEHLWSTASILREERRLKQIENLIIFKLHKENNNKKNVFTFFIFYLLWSSSLFSGFTFYKEALCFIIFILSLCSNMLNLENILEYIRQKLKKHAHLKFHPGMKCLQVFFSFFHPRMKFHPCLSSRDEISSRQKRANSKRHFTIDRDDFILGWNFTCKHPRNRDEISSWDETRPGWKDFCLHVSFI